MYAKSNQGTGTLTRNFVRQMAKQFEQISTESMSFVNSHEANFKQCNWWLDMPSAACFDDLTSDANQSQHNDVSPQYTIDRENVVHDVETAEIANENTIHDLDLDKNNFFNHIAHCLQLPPKLSIDGNVVISDDSDELKTPIAISETESVSDVFLSSIDAPDLAEVNNWTATLRPSTSQSTSNTSSLSSPSRASQNSSNSVSSVTSGQITNTVEELLYNEETYIKALNNGIDGYMKNFIRKDMPAILRGQKYRVFGNVHRIKDFHENIFFPALKQCNMDIVKICNTFCDFIEREYFYIYILYAINHQKSEKICITHRDYFKRIQNEIGDKLGVNSFLVQPIQRLPKYKLLLGQLFSELGKRFGVHDDSIKNELGACCLAEKRIQRLLDTLNGSMNINDIVDCELHTLCQGKFVLVDRFDIYEKSDLRRRYKGKVFLFEKCIIYTEQLSKNKLLYRGHFRHVTLGFTFEDQRNYFRLYNERKGNQEIEFSSDATVVQLWIQMLNRTMTAVVQQEKKKIRESRSQSIKNELSPLQILLGNTIPGVRDALYPLAIDGGSSSGGESQRNTLSDFPNSDVVSIKSNKSLDAQLNSQRTTWYTKEFDDERRLIERFQNSEKFYIQLLKNAVTTFLTDLPDDLRTNVETYLKSIKRIKKFHTDTFHPQLLQCEMKTIAICDLIKSHLDRSDFNAYLKYAAYVHEALQMIRNFHQNSDNNKVQPDDDPSSDIDSLLLMPINHISNYAQFLDGLLNEYKSRDLLASDFKTIAAVEIEMKKLQKMVVEHYALNSMKGLPCIARKFGLITYSDEISVDFTKCRIMILELGLVCVRTRISTKTKKEKFIDQLFSIPILNIELHENDAYPKKMRIIADNASHVNYTVTFSTTRKKKQFMDAIRMQRNHPNRNH